MFLNQEAVADLWLFARRLAKGQVVALHLHLPHHQQLQ